MVIFFLVTEGILENTKTKIHSLLLGQVLPNALFNPKEIVHVPDDYANLPSHCRAHAHECVCHPELQTTGLTI